MSVSGEFQTLPEGVGVIQSDGVIVFHRFHFKNE